MLSAIRSGKNETFIQFSGCRKLLRNIRRYGIYYFREAICARLKRSRLHRPSSCPPPTESCCRSPAVPASIEPVFARFMGRDYQICFSTISISRSSAWGAQRSPPRGRLGALHHRLRKPPRSRLAGTPMPALSPPCGRESDFSILAKLSARNRKRGGRWSANLETVFAPSRPLCPAGHLPHTGGDRLSRRVSPIAGVAERAAGKTAG